jgi:energy-coupling factor transporter ATP-binding protein EcfA2
MYDHSDNRFLTVTGDRCAEPPNDINQRNDVFGDLYREHFEDDEDEDQTTLEVSADEEPTTDIDLSDEQLLEKARNAENGAKFCALESGVDSMHSGDTSEADKAFCQLLAFWTQGDADRMDRLFQQSHRTRDKWDETHSGDGDTYGEMTIDAALDDQTEYYDPNHGRQGTGPEEDTGEERDDLPNPDEFDVRNGGYGYLKEQKDHDGNVTGHRWISWTNFQLETVEFLRLAESDDDLRITIRVHPSTSEEAYEVTVPTTTFNDPRSFRDRVVIGLSTTFEAGSKVLNKLRRFVAGQDAPYRVGVEQVGLYGLDDDEQTEWVTPSGSITAEGWAAEPQYAFDGRDTAVSRGWSLEPTEDGYDREAVAETLRLLPRTRLSERFIPVLGWYYAAPLRPYIMRWEGEFNQLNVTGDTGSGKTTTLGVLNQLFGGDREPLSATATSFSIMSSFAASNAMPVVFDEYKPSDMADYEVNRFHEYYRKSSRGAVETRGNRDMSVDSYPLRAPVAVAGEQAISGPAEERRSVASAFSTRAIEKHSTTREAFAQLAGLSYEDASGEIEHFDGIDPRHHAAGYYRFITGLDAGELHDMWLTAEERVRECLAQMGGDVADEVRDAEKRALQTVVFGVGIYRSFADEHNVDEAVTLENVTTDVKVALEYLVGGNNGQSRGGRSSHVDRLLGLMARVAYAETLEEGTHYTFVDEGEPDELLAIKLGPAFDETRRYARDHDVRGEDLLDSANDYRGRLADAAERDDSVIVDTSRQVWGLTRSVVIHVGRAMETIDGFDRDMFFPEETNKHVGVGVNPDMLSEAHAAADGGADADTENELERAHHTQQERVTIISDALRTLADRAEDNEGVSRDEIAEFVQENHGIEPDTTHSRLNQFVRDGKQAYETDEDRLLPL